MPETEPHIDRDKAIPVLSEGHVRHRFSLPGEYMQEQKVKVVIDLDEVKNRLPGSAKKNTRWQRFLTWVKVVYNARD